MHFLSEKSQNVVFFLLQIAFPSRCCFTERNNARICSCYRLICVVGKLKLMPYLEYVMTNKAVVSQKIVLVIDARGANIMLIEFKIFFYS